MALRVLSSLRRSAVRASSQASRALSAAAGASEAEASSAVSVIAGVPLAEASAAQRLQFFPLTAEAQAARFPEGVGSRLDETFELVGHRHILLRDAALEVIEAMQSWGKADNDRPHAVVLDGERGAGKSFALHQIVQFARESGWIALFVPRARAWCVEAPYVMKSPYVADKFDIDVFGVELLQQLLAAHGDQLAQVKVRGDYGDRYYPAKLGAKPKTAGTFDKAELTLRDLVENGIHDEELACAAVVDLREEFAQVTEFPVLIAIDEYNTWFQKTVFGFEGQEVFPSDISVIDALKDVDAKGLKPKRALANGLFVAAVTENYPSKFDFKKQVDYRALRKTLRVYSPEELERVVAYYNEVSFLQGESPRLVIVS